MANYNPARVATSGVVGSGSSRSGCWCRSRSSGRASLRRRRGADHAAGRAVRGRHRHRGRDLRARAVPHPGRGEPRGARRGRGRPLAPSTGRARHAPGRGRGLGLASPDHDDDRTGRHPRERAPVADPRVRGAGAAGLRAGAAHASRGRSSPTPRATSTSTRAGCSSARFDVGPEHRDGHGHPPEHRLPLPDGPVLLGPAPARRARVGVAAALARLDPFGAALGVLFLLRTLHVRGPGVAVATVVFMLTPYTLDFSSRISVILLPWAGLPWMLALTIRALRAGDGGHVEVRGDLRHRRADHRRSERDRARVRGHRAGVVDRLRGAGRRGELATRAGRDRARIGCSRWSRRCGGSRASGRRAATGSTS